MSSTNVYHSVAAPDFGPRMTKGADDGRDFHRHLDIRRREYVEVIGRIRRAQTIVAEMCKHDVGTHDAPISQESNVFSCRRVCCPALIRVKARPLQPTPC
jgi:hypothetical protein